MYGYGQWLSSTRGSHDQPSVGAACRRCVARRAHAGGHRGLLRCQQRDAPYSGAVERLAALDPGEAQEQLRDWARLGLASSLGLSRKQLVDALYDTTPIRDPLFTDLAAAPTGPGRARFDGTTLHILVPQDDPHPSRTIGLLLDQHRVDARTDPVMVQVHRYLVRPERQRIELSAEPAAPAGEVRAAHGWHEARVDQPQGLAGFLAATTHLSRLQTRGSEIWAGGWRWPDTPTAPVTVEDVSALQRSYRQPGGISPDFSLDPQTPSTVADVRAAIPGLAPDLAERVISRNWAGARYPSAAELAQVVKGTLFWDNPPAEALPARGLPADRTQLWALDNLLEGAPVYSQARYDGGLAGTEVGMSLFYTDLVAKDWTVGVGEGVPSRAVPGFVPDTMAPTPPGMCPGPGEPVHELGRLWFGQNDTGFAFEPNAVGIGAQATRLFSRTNGPEGREIEPSYASGRGLRWWDQHYREIADFEPQYQRLEQLMRWSGALEWLTTNGSGLLPQLPDREIRSDLRFASWYAAHHELREHAQLSLVTPPSANNAEALLPTPSKATPNCGTRQIDVREIRGGVSLANLLTRARGLPSGTAKLPRELQRAGFTDASTTNVDLTTGTGRIEHITPGQAGEVADRYTQVLRRDPGAASVETTGSPRRSIPFEGARLKGETGPRQFRTQFRSEGRDFEFDVSYSFLRESVAELGVTQPPSSGVRQTDIVLQVGLLSHLRAAIEKIRQDPARGLDASPEVLYRYPEPGGQMVYRLNEGWIEVGFPGRPTSLRTSLVAELLTQDGQVVEVRAGTPQRLSPMDVEALEITQQPSVARYRDMLTAVPAGIPIYRGDVASLVGGERAAALPAAIPADALVSFRIVRPTGNGHSPGPVSREGRAWSVIGSGVGGGSGALLWAPGGQVVLVTVCHDPQQQPQPDKDCQ
jgi:hypothetical protein